MSMLSTVTLIELYPYSSRRIAKFSSLADYRSFESAEGMATEATEESKFNFNEGNGLDASIVLNDPIERGNYLLVSDSDGNILSRWFAMEKTRTTNYAKKQYQYRLRRDVLADYLDEWVNAEAFIRKGTITDPRSPLLFNKEDMTFNAVKRAEIMIPDETRCQWIVGYIARNAELTDSAQKLGGAVEVFPDAGTPLPNALQFATLDDLYAAIGAKEGTFAVLQSGSLRVDLSIEHTTGRTFRRVLTKDADGDYGNEVSTGASTPTLDGIAKVTDASIAKAILANEDVLSLLSQSLGEEIIPFSKLPTAYAGRTVYVTALGKNYQISITTDFGSANLTYRDTPTSGSTLFSTISSALDTSAYELVGSWATGNFQLRASFPMKVTVKLIELPSNAIRVSLSSPNLRQHLQDAPYDMFCIPCSTGQSDAVTLGRVSITTSQGVLAPTFRTAWAAATAIVENLASGTYDLQLLPYCPNRDIIAPTSATDPTIAGLDCSSLSVDFAYEGTATRDSTTGEVTSFEATSASVPIIWCSRSSFTFITSPRNLPDDFSYPTDPKEVKIKNETCKARIVSPNLAGGFDFSPMMNGGCSSFRVDCTYKPFNPYIHVAPVFSFLYGGDYGDARGLVCGGDFSLPRITDAWEQYQQANKNYQSIFDREMQNLEVTQKYQRVGEVFGGIAGTVSGAVGGAIGGSYLGFGGVGAAVGGAASLAGGIADLAISDRLRAEAIDYKKDLFGYQLGNIQALPYSIAKTAAQNANNRPFPFIEVYRATDEEIEALRSKLEYDGETVGIISEPSGYISGSPCYIQCALASYGACGCDADVWNAISEELLKGVYVYDYYEEVT